MSMEIIKENILFVAIGVAILLILLVLMIIIKKKRKNKLKNTDDALIDAEIEGEDEEDFVEHEPPSADYIAEITGLEEVYTKAGQNFFTIKLQIKDGPITLDSIEPNHNKYGAIHNYNGLINREYAQCRELKIFFDKGKFGVRLSSYKFKFDLRYTDAEGRKWKQAFVYQKPLVKGMKHIRPVVPA